MGGGCLTSFSPRFWPLSRAIKDALHRFEISLQVHLSCLDRLVAEPKRTLGGSRIHAVSTARVFLLSGVQRSLGPLPITRSFAPAPRCRSAGSVPAISIQSLVTAVVRVERMTFNERERLADEVYAHQPNLLASVVVLQRYGVTLEQMEVVLNVLLVFYEAMRASGKTWPVISEDTQDICMQRVTVRVRFIEGLTPEQQSEPTLQGVGLHPEQQLLAYVFGKLRDHGFLGVATEAEKMIMLAMLNMVECIAEAAPTTASAFAQRAASRPRRRGQ